MVADSWTGCFDQAVGDAGLTSDEHGYEAAPSRWWWVAIGLTAVVAVLATVVAVALRDLGWTALAVTTAVTSLLLTAGEARMPRRVSASGHGLRVSSRRRSHEVAWHELRRVRDEGRGPRRHDAWLERVDGRLAGLPRATPVGTVEAWRDETAGHRPPATLPQVWRLHPDQEDPRFTGLLMPGWAVVTVPVARGLWSVSPPAAVAAVVVLLGLLVLAMSRLSPRFVTVDEQHLSRPGWWNRPVGWDRVVAVRAADGRLPRVVLELRGGVERQVTGPDVDVVRDWWQLARPQAAASTDGGR